MPFDAYSAEKAAHNEQMASIARLAVLLGIPAILAVAGWVGLGLIAVQSDVVKVVQRADGLASSVNDIKESVDKINDLITARAPTRYTTTDAARDFAVRDQRLDQHEHRIEVLEGRFH